MTTDEACIQLKRLQRLRRELTNTITMLTNRAGAFVRLELFLAGHLEAGDKEVGIVDPKSIGTRVASAIMNDKPIPKDFPMVVTDELRETVIATVGMVPKIDLARKRIEKQMLELAKQLPGYEFVSSVKGVGAGSIGFPAVIGLAGNLSNYPNPQKLIKRLGLAPQEGRAYSTWRMKGGLTAQDWTDARYDPKARSLVYSNLQDSMVKHQIKGAVYAEDKKTLLEPAQPKGPFGKLLLEYKAKQTALYGDTLSKGHINNRATRYMVSQFLIALWCAWNGRTYNKFA
jgi:hypothetical protein